MAIIAAQSREMKRVNQVAERRVSSLSKLRNGFSDGFTPLCAETSSLLLRRENASASQHRERIPWDRIRHRFTRAKARNEWLQLGSEPEWLQRTSSWVAHPSHRSPQVEILQQMPLRLQFGWKLAVGEHRALRIEKELLSRMVLPAARPELPTRDQVQR